MRRGLSVVLLISVIVVVITSYLVLSNNSILFGEAREFLVEDSDGGVMIIEVTPNKQEVIKILANMVDSGDEKWVGGELERVRNRYSYRFKPETIVVADVIADGLQASKYITIQKDFDYWQSLKTVYIKGNVIKVLK